MTFLCAVLAVCAVLVVAGCGGGGGSTGVSSATSGVGAETGGTPTKLVQPLTPFKTLAKCESLYRRVYVATARKIKVLSALGSTATPAQRRELAAAETKHGQALEFCEEEIELEQVRERQRSAP